MMSNDRAPLNLTDDRWIVRFRPVQRAGLRLICFPYAGGGASIYRSWAENLSDDVEVCAIQLPGREDRLDEGLIRNFRDLMNALIQVIPGFIDVPTAFFGHSLGAIIGYELARRLYKENGWSPVYLFVSGRSAPHIFVPGSQIHLLPDDLFLDAIGKLEGTPEEILQHAKLRQLYLPILRADTCLSESYLYLLGNPLSCPISAFGGLEDDTVKRKALNAWRKLTQAGFRLRMLPGDHFFLRNSQQALLKAIADDLSTVEIPSKGPAS